MPPSRSGAGQRLILGGIGLQSASSAIACAQRHAGSLCFRTMGDGMSVVLDYAETIATRLRSFRDASVSCFSGDVIPVGPGSSMSPPGMQSDVTLYQCAIGEVVLHSIWWGVGAFSL